MTESKIVDTPMMKLSDKARQTRNLKRTLTLEARVEKLEKRLADLELKDKARAALAASKAV